MSEQIKKEKPDPALQQNERLIQRTIREHLKIEDETAQKNLEKLFIYNLLN